LVSFLPAFASAIFAALTVRLLDDITDAESDAALRRRNLAASNMPGAAAYMVLAMVVAVALQPRVAVGVVGSSYALGMAFGTARRLPSRLTTVEEIIAVLMVALLFCGWRVAGAALGAVLTMQLIDDAVDLKLDVDTRNLVRLLSRGGSVIVGLLALTAGMFASTAVAWACLLGGGIVWAACGR
jgi:hypothetical protein